MVKEQNNELVIEWNRRGRQWEHRVEMQEMWQCKPANPRIQRSVNVKKKEENDERKQQQ